MRILCGPARGNPIQWTLGVVFLIGDHASDANDEIVEALGCGPEIPNTDRAIVKIRMKYRCQHAALRRAPGIAQSKVYFQQMFVALQYRAIGSHIEPPQVEVETIDLRRHTSGSGNLNYLRSGKTLQERFVVDLEPPNSR